MLETLQWVMDKFMEIEVAHKTGAEKGIQAKSRTGYRCGYRIRRFDTRLGIVIFRCPRYGREATFRKQWNALRKDLKIRFSSTPLKNLTAVRFQVRTRLSVLIVKSAGGHLLWGFSPQLILTSG